MSANRTDRPSVPDGDATGPAAGDREGPAVAVAARGLTKVYRGTKRTPPKEALKAIDLEIPRGSLFGLLGPNGAGKSTFINILAGLVNKTAGEVRIWGCDIDRERRQASSAIGIVPQELNLDAFFTPRELLDLHAGLYAVPKSERRTMEILEAVGLADKADAYSRTLSGGMRRRMMVAKAMVHNPPVLVLDEPTAGVDVELRKQLWDQVRGLNRQGTTILLTTHYLEEAEQLCDRIGIINHGQLIAHDTTEGLIGRLDRKALTIITADAMTTLPDAVARYDSELLGPRCFVVRYRPSETRIRDILSAVRGAGINIADLSTQESDLEDLFIELTRDPPPDDPVAGEAAE